MKAFLIIILIIIVLGVAYFFYSQAGRQNEVAGLQKCPDEMIVNRMPGTSPQSSYYIDNGLRREISEYDAVWVAANCNVPVQEVF